MGAAHPGLVAGLVALRLAAFAASPGTPLIVTAKAPQTGAFVDFEHLVRLQRLMRDTRQALKERYPTLPAGSAASYYYLPPGTEYAFGGHKALQGSSRRRPSSRTAHALRWPKGRRS